MDGEYSAIAYCGLNEDSLADWTAASRKHPPTCKTCLKLHTKDIQSKYWSPEYAKWKADQNFRLWK